MPELMDLQPVQAITIKGELPALVLVEIIQRQNEVIRDLLARVEALEP